MVLISESTIVDVLLVATTLLVLLFSYFQYAYKYWERRKVPFLQPTFPLGNRTKLITKTAAFGLECSKYYDEIKKRGLKFAGIYTVIRPVLVVIDPDYIRDILSKDFQHFVDRGLYYNEKDDPISAHLFSLDESEWKDMRVKLTPTFTSGKMKMMFQSLVDVSHYMSDAIDKSAMEKKDIDIRQFLANFTTDVIGTCAFGIECNSFKDPDSEFTRMGNNMFHIGGFSRMISLIMIANLPDLSRKIAAKHNAATFYWCCGVPVRSEHMEAARGEKMEATQQLATCIFEFLKVPGLRYVREDISRFLHEVVAKTVKYREDNNYSRPDFLQMLIDLKKNSENTANPFTMEQLTAQVFLFFIAGFDTSSTTMTFSLYELCRNPEIQEKARKEVNEVLDAHGGKITYESLSEMKYLQQVIDEAQRLFPPVVSLTRTCIKDYNLRNTDITIAKGTPVLLPVYSLHRDADYYPDPDKFDPERFSAENKQSRHPYVHLPFGEGPRNCIGLRFGLMQSRIGLATILRQFRLRISPSTKMPLKLDNQVLLLKSTNTLYVTAEKI